MDLDKEKKVSSFSDPCRTLLLLTAHLLELASYKRGELQLKSQPKLQPKLQTQKLKLLIYQHYDSDL